MKNNQVKVRTKAVQQDLFAEAPAPPAIAVATLEEIRSALAELQVSAMRANGKA